MLPAAVPFDGWYDQVVEAMAPLETARERKLSLEVSWRPMPKTPSRVKSARVKGVRNEKPMLSII